MSKFTVQELLQMLYRGERMELLAQQPPSGEYKWGTSLVAGVYSRGYDVEVEVTHPWSIPGGSTVRLYGDEIDRLLRYAGTGDMDADYISGRMSRFMYEVELPVGCEEG